MTQYIAVAGKGGVGKTTFITLMLKQIIREKDISILAVDADPNANLHETLGITFTSAISESLEEYKNIKSSQDEDSKAAFFEKLDQSLVKTPKFDFITMGTPQREGCYCYPNNILRMYLEKLGGNYDLVVIDSEAGMEHISRLTIPHIDIMFVISDSSARGIRSAGRVHKLIKGLQANVDQVYLIVTRTIDNNLEHLAGEIAKTGLQLIGDIPSDELIFERDVAGKPLFDLPDEAISLQAVDKILRKANIL